MVETRAQTEVAHLAPCWGGRGGGGLESMVYFGHYALSLPTHYACHSHGSPSRCYYHLRLRHEKSGAERNAHPVG